MEKTKEELAQIVHDSELLERGKTIYSLKWVEKVVFWIIVATATAVIGALIKVYIVDAVIKAIPK